MTQATVDLLTEIINAWPNTIEGSSTKEKLSFVDDPIAMSCASWRLDQQGLGSYSNLETVIVESEDRVLAAKIRKHFLDKLTLQKLRGKEQSTFRTKLHRWPVELTVLHSNPLYGIIDSLYDLGMFRINGRVWPRQFYESSRTYIKLSTFRLVGLGV